jgi:hypothetical protein
LRRAGSQLRLFVVLVAFCLPVYAQENAGPISDPPIAQKNQGDIAEDDIAFQMVFASEELVEKAIAAVRDAGLFAPVSASFERPFMEFHITFLYNLPMEPQRGYR